MRSVFSLKLVACSLLIGAGLFAGCTTEETADTGGSGGSAAGAGGSAAGSGGSTAGSGGSDAGAGGSDAGAGGSDAGAGGSDAGAGGSDAGAGGSDAGAGGSDAGAGGSEAAGSGGSEAAGSGGSEAAGSGGSEAGGSGGGSQGTATYVRVANLVVGYKAKAIDVCTKAATDADWSNSVPLFKNSGQQTASDQFFSPTVSVWFEAQTLGEVEFRFVSADATDCNTKVSDKIADFKTALEEGKSYTIMLAGDSGTGGSSKPIQLYSLEMPAGDATAASIAYFNGVVNVPAGVNMGVYETSDKTFTEALSAGKTAIKYAEGDAILVDPFENNLGLRRADTKVVLSTSPNAYSFKAGGHYTVLATGTNEFAETASNNLPWLVLCDDDSNETVANTNLVANCVYSQGPQFGVK